MWFGPHGKACHAFFLLFPGQFSLKMLIIRIIHALCFANLGLQDCMNSATDEQREKVWQYLNLFVELAEIKRKQA